jgi:hypothetical protein
LLQGLRVLFHHSLIDVYGHCVFSLSSPATSAYQACVVIYSRAYQRPLERPLRPHPEGRSKGVVNGSIIRGECTLPLPG